MIFKINQSVAHPYTINKISLPPENIPMIFSKLSDFAYLKKKMLFYKSSRDEAGSGGTVFSV